ncbi:ribonuclease E/G [Thalassospiraceae bacterium LMO-SO8]|nr:ribonuclease E/G [Alphaproteobacteria bacterium LMO-S08]WND76318.1 ribonuclease E/G [Thalassospiraceae bacterium LMO-SO8]
MPTTRMLIDASHPEETRVVIANGSRLEEFDVESESRKQLKGNIYLAKVTRVEPSLQACFVDYGGNRHGFLAFSEIHPDYYQIPIADREALVAEHQEQEAKAHEDGDEDDGEGVEVLGGEDEEIPVRRPVNLRRQYKIQEVVKRRQILLVQVVKEERGNKGAALTTYLSLAGRYCVLMPNTARGGGISRKIAQSGDRKKLKQILGELDIPQGMAVIVRTAGSKRTKAEIRRDYDYLLRLWGEVREKTLKSIAPALVHEESDIVKRAIRDLYTKDIDEIIVQGNEAYRAAKDFMKLLIPSHAKKVQPHEDGSIPLFQQFQVESQMDAMHEPEVQLRSGGYIVINPTEALVSIDVNSGRATKERNIEETALKTNMEAAEEIARQLRLRDLAGLIVIDFIDMEVSRNQAKVERCLKDAMRNDRARIQIGRISPFGLLELSRQRLRPALHETSFEPCAHCGGSGIRRSTESTALQMLRVLGEEGQKGRSSQLTLITPTAVALYLFNNKRHAINDMEQRFNLTIRIEADDTLIPPDHRLERVKSDGGVETVTKAPAAATPAAATAAATTVDGDSDGEKSEEEGGRRRRRRSRRRKRGGEGDAHDTQETRTDNDANEPAEGGEETDADGDGEPRETREGTGEQSEDGAPKRRRRGRRGGRRRRRPEEGRSEDGQTEIAADAGGEPQADDAVSDAPTPDAPASDAPAADVDAPAISAETGGAPAAEAAGAEASETPPEVAEKPKRTRARRAPKAAEDGDGEDKPAKPRRRRTAKKAADTAAEPQAADGAAPATEAVAEQSAPEAPSPEAAPAPAPEPAPQPEPEPAMAVAPPEPAEPETDSAKTVVIEVGADTETANARRGWWNRLVD